MSLIQAVHDIDTLVPTASMVAGISAFLLSDGHTTEAHTVDSTVNDLARQVPRCVLGSDRFHIAMVVVANDHVHVGARSCPGPGQAEV